MHTALLLATGVFWTAAYGLLIRVGLRERTFGMPIVAFATNISWEFMFSFVRPASGVMRWIDLVWFGFDVVIGWTVVRYGADEFGYLPRRAFWPALAALLALAYVGMDQVSVQFDQGGGSLTAFGSNLAMSALFLSMLVARRGLRGQSVGIAAAKLLGTGCASLSMLTASPVEPRYDNALMAYLYVACLLVDAAYLAAVLAVRRYGWPRTTAAFSAQPVAATSIQ